tara:strand:+ start:826 stop:1191 length:366 start_codon:yes stop_codon:yes gene_type:complete
MFGRATSSTAAGLLRRNFPKGSVLGGASNVHKVQKIRAVSSSAGAFTKRNHAEKKIIPQIIPIRYFSKTYSAAISAATKSADWVETGNKVPDIVMQERCIKKLHELQGKIFFLDFYMSFNN